MMLQDLFTLNDLQRARPGEVLRTVTTKYHRVVNGSAMLTFVVVKGDNPNPSLPDWAIYCHYTDNSVQWIANHGDKVTSEGQIRAIFPCDDECFSRYRK